MLYPSLWNMMLNKPSNSLGNPFTVSLIILRELYNVKFPAEIHESEVDESLPVLSSTVSLITLRGSSERKAQRGQTFF